MANFLYAKAKEELLSALLNLSSDTVKVSLVTASYSPNAATDQYQSAITPYLASGTTDQAVTGQTITAGKFTHNPVTWTAVPNGVGVKYVVFYDAAGGSAATNKLLLCLDTATGLPLTGNGGNVTFTPDATYGAFSL